MAVKTVVYEARDGAEHAAAVMETAISASVGHRNVVRVWYVRYKLRAGALPQASVARVPDACLT